jgi:hypothetical protein
MIHHRVQGISHLVTVCQCLLTLALFWIWYGIYGALIPGAAGTSPAAYAGYGLLLCLGLGLESLVRGRPAIPFPSRRPSLIRQMPRAIRQTAAVIGFLLLVLVLTKDRYFSRLFLVSFAPVFYLLLLLSGHFLPRFLRNQLFRGSRQTRAQPLATGPGKSVRPRSRIGETCDHASDSFATPRSNLRLWRSAQNY